MAQTVPARQTVQNMTDGSPVSLILRFALPIFISQVFQQLYSTADAFIVGKYLGTNAFAAVSSSGTLIMLLTAVRPDLQAEGINAVMMDHVCQSCNRHGVRFAETGPMLELNDHILAQWKRLEKEQHKRRRCFIKDLDHDVNAANAAAAQTETPETESAE